MVLNVTGKSHPNGTGILIYIPQVMAMDSRFPFRPGDRVELSVRRKLLVVKKDDENVGDSDEQ